MTALENTESSVAIIGMAGRFPGAKTIEQFWQNLKSGVESIEFFAADDLEFSFTEETIKTHPDYVRARGIIHDVDQFDADFFGINPREAEIMDPQHRLFLECAWEAMENSGYVPEKFAGAIGVIAGSYHNTYLLNNLYSNRSLLDLVGGDVIMHGNSHDHLASHIAYKLNLNGPSFTVQTACSSSLVAVHLACQQLLTGESDMVLAGGVCISVPEKSGYLYQSGGIQSPDGHCYAFDEKAAGTVFGNGLGIVVLKRLDDAIASGDHIYAVIRGSACNNDGSQKLGYMAPSVGGQAAVIAQALAVADVSPESISYIETHGTGTQLGDEVEMAALQAVYQQELGKRNYCGVGSVKPNIGHLNAASGIAGLIKASLALQNKTLPPTINCATPNPRIDFANSAFYVNTVCSEWKEQPTKRRAGVSSFGVGGTNAHLILEEAAQDNIQKNPGKSKQILLISAKTNIALDAATENLRAHLEQSPTSCLADVAFTLQAGREDFAYRRFVVCSNTAEAVSELMAYNSKPKWMNQVLEPQSSKMVFLFPGQGSQYINMAQGLYREQPVFREYVDRCSELLFPHLGINLTTILFPKNDLQGNAEQLLQQTAHAQPALFVIEYALAQLWMSWGIQPEIMIGHSIGEYVAACLSGVFSLADALKVVAARGALMQAQIAGAMLAVSMSAEDIKSLLNDDLSVAAINTANTCVISGSFDAVENLQTVLLEKNIAHQKLRTSHAFHSQMMDGILKAYFDCLQTIQLNAPTIPFISNLTGKMIKVAEATDTQYWVNHLRNTVLFANGIATILATAVENQSFIFLEVGPAQTLSSFVQSQLSENSQHHVLSSIRHPKIQHDDLAFLLITLGQLWLQDVKINWPEFYRDEACVRVPLPTYPFQRQRYWIEAKADAKTVARQQFTGKNPNLLEWFYLPSWKQSALSLTANSFTEIKHWLVFIDDKHSGADLIAFLKQKQQFVTVVESGTQFSQGDQNHIVINPSLSQDFVTLIESIQLPDKVIYLTSSGQQNFSNFNSLLFLAQALGKQNNLKHVDLYVVTHNIQAVIGDDLLCPHNAIVMGPCKVIPQEYPNIACASIDIATQDALNAEHPMFNHLMAEFSSESLDSIVAYRGHYRWIQTFQPLQVKPLPAKTPMFREKGVYLITGGLGGIGLTLASYLAQHWHANLILVGRSDFPTRSEWSTWLMQHDAADETSKKITALMAVEAQGASVQIYSADVTNEIEMQNVIVQATETFGGIHGVIHAAGIAGGGLMQTKTDTAAANVMNPKIQGAVVLAKLFSPHHLDFMLFCSSINAILNVVGQVDYCAANAFLDAYAHYLTVQTGQLTVSVNWDTWQEVGMAVNTSVPMALRGIREDSIKQGICPLEAAELFRYILAANVPQLIISTQELSEVIATHRQYTLASLLDSKGENAAIKSTHQRPNLKVAFVAPESEIEIKLSVLWEELLGIKGIGVEDNFFDLGGHSLLGSQVLARCREMFGVELSLDTIFNLPTIADLAIVIEDKILEDIEEIA